VFSPTSDYTENKIRTTALVGVFTNKSLYRKQKSAPPPLLVFSPTSVYNSARNVLAVNQCCLFNQSWASDHAEKITWWFVKTQTTKKNPSLLLRSESLHNFIASGK
jgi:hypothetical protein